MATQTGLRLTITGRCDGCCHLRMDADVYRCAHPKASSVAEPMICSAHREPRPPAWCPELPAARLALARGIVAEAEPLALPLPDDAQGNPSPKQRPDAPSDTTPKQKH